MPWLIAELADAVHQAAPVPALGGKDVGVRRLGICGDFDGDIHFLDQYLEFLS